MTYDADGNQTSTAGTFGPSRTLNWTEDDRLRSETDSGFTTTFLYDADGERSHKRRTTLETWYVNPYYVVKNSLTETKHIVMGTDRIVSEVAAISNRFDPATAGNSTQYYYHPDHLQSTGFVSGADGSLMQHDEYFPSGEVWFQEQKNNDARNTQPYLFSAKELDETGLYYFGARYYNPKFSTWTSADPVLNSYMRGQINGGVLNPANLGLYSYVSNNPIVHRDPDGRAQGVPMAALQEQQRQRAAEAEAAKGVNPEAFARAARRGIRGGPADEFAAKNAWVMGAITLGDFSTLAAHVAYANGGMNAARAGLGEGMRDTSAFWQILGELALTPAFGVLSIGGEVAAGGERMVTLFHGTTPSAAARIVANGFRAAGTDAVFFGEDLATARFFGQVAALERGTSGAYTVLRFEVPESMVGLFQRGSVGAFRGVRFADIPGGSGIEAILTTKNIGTFNSALKSGAVGVQRLRFAVGGM